MPAGDDPTTRLLASIADIGSQDIYTDAWEYSGRVEAMRALIRLTEDLLAGRSVTADAVSKAHNLEEADVER